MSKTLAAYCQFLWASLFHQQQTGAVVPSQRFLIAKMIAPIPVDYSGQIIELGPGSGVLTLKLAARCPRARILACEINPALAKFCRETLADSGLHRRVEVVCDSAEHFLSQFRRQGATPPDFVLSGIPLGNLNRAQVLSLVDAISGVLKPGGLYIQFQYTLMDRKKIQSRFARLRTLPAFLNFPPAFVYYARK